MTTHIVKLCVGVDSIEDLEHWQAERLATSARENGQPELFHRTRMVPKRQDAVLDGGSLYWVIRGVIQVRQQILALEEGQKDDGTRCCRIMLHSELVAVRPTPRRAFQGWRYLEADDAPPDIGRGRGKQLAAMPAQMRRELAELCLI
ncbi:MAG: DUF1489 domain-containing protein [Hyphomicrobiaceae bacterium]